MAGFVGGIVGTRRRRFRCAADTGFSRSALLWSHGRAQRPCTYHPPDVVVAPAQFAQLLGDPDLEPALDRLVEAPPCQPSGR